MKQRFAAMNLTRIIEYMYNINEFAVRNEHPDKPKGVGWEIPIVDDVVVSWFTVVAATGTNVF